MRQVVLDVESTGIDFRNGDRIIEIGLIELYNAEKTGHSLHLYINPQYRIHPEAFKIHGLSESFLRDKPKFAEIAEEVKYFIKDSEIIAHNGIRFDVPFLSLELQAAGLGPLKNRAIDTMAMMRLRFPGAPSNLEAMCKRLDIDTSSRVKHGALIDAELLAEVYKRLVRDDQMLLDLITTKPKEEHKQYIAKQRPNKLPDMVSDKEFWDHIAFMSSFGEESLWIKLKML